MGNCTVGFLDACHVALPVLILRLWEAYQEPQQVRNNGLEALKGRGILGANEGVPTITNEKPTIVSVCMMICCANNATQGCLP